MKKQWFVSLGQEHERRVNKLFLTFAVSTLSLIPNYDVKISDQAPKEIRVGDQIQLNIINLQVPSTQGIHFGVPPGLSPEKLQEEGFILSKDLSVAVIKAGQLTLPSLVIQDAAGQDLGRTNPLIVTAASAIKPQDPQPQIPAENLPPLSLPFPWPWIVGLAGLALVILSGILYALIRWSQKKRPLMTPPPADPKKSPEQIALEQLAKLEQLDLVRKGQHKKHYFGVSEIMKKYLGERYGFDALESTTGELLDSLQKATASSDVVEKIRELYTDLDQVKFTDHVPTVESGVEVLKAARRVVG